MNTPSVTVMEEDGEFLFLSHIHALVELQILQLEEKDVVITANWYIFFT